MASNHEFVSDTRPGHIVYKPRVRKFQLPRLQGRHMSAEELARAEIRAEMTSSEKQKEAKEKHTDYSKYYDKKNPITAVVLGHAVSWQVGKREQLDSFRISSKKKMTIIDMGAYESQMSLGGAVES